MLHVLQRLERNCRKRAMQAALSIGEHERVVRIGALAASGQANHVGEPRAVKKMGSVRQSAHRPQGARPRFGAIIDSTDKLNRTLARAG